MTEEKHECTKFFFIGGKTSDMADWTLPDGREGDGYVPQLSGVGEGGWGDYINIRICIECGKVKDFPIGEKEFYEAWEALGDCW